MTSSCHAGHAAWRHDAAASCVDYDEYEIAEWLIEKADVNARPLLMKMVSAATRHYFAAWFQPNYWMNFKDFRKTAPFTELL